MIIVLSGKKRVGKDTIADEMKHQIFMHYAKMGVPNNQIVTALKTPLAMPIKRIVSDMMGVPINELDGHKDIPLLGFEKFKSNKTPRDFYKEVGDRLSEIFGKECFVKHIVREIQSWQQKIAEHFIIPDMRFDFEFNYLKQISDIVFIRVKRDIPNNDTHPSETSLDNVPDSEFNYVIENNQNLLFLKEEIERILKELKIITNE